MTRGPANPWDANWPDLQRATIFKAAVVLLLVAWYGWYRVSAMDFGDLRVTGVAVLAVVICLWVAHSERLPPSWAAAIQVATVFAAVYLCYALLRLQVAMVFFVVPILMAASALPLWMAPALAVVACIATASTATAPRETLWVYHLLYLSVGALTVLLAGELRAALRHAWHYTAHTTALAREVRARQEEVNRLNKALKLSNGLLKRSFHELALAQKETAEARHLKEQFATTVSHELRTPLSIILGFVDVMQHYPDVYGEVNWTPVLRRDLSEIQRSAKYLSRLVDDILDLARVQALKMPIHREQTDLRSLMEEVIDLASRLLLEKSSVRLQLDVPEYLPSLYLDHTRIRQVLLNLLANACRFTMEGEIRVQASLEQDEVLVSVSDTGPGIPAEQLETIFEEFRQGAPPAIAEQRDAGKGLGLAIAKHFVHMHGGRIWAESKPGQGSTFYFSLPIAHKQIVALSAPSSRDVLHGSELPLVILVDEGEGQAFLARHLEQYQVVAVPDMAQARKLVREQHPHAVIVNVPPEPGDARQGTAPPILPEPV
ncbi:MAG: sensor histidine kinase, partial [Anaerolineae bacterium]